MILQALTAYYEAMLKKGIVAPPGWDKTFKVSFWLELNDSGELIDVIDQRHDEQRGKKTVLVPLPMSVPAHVKRSSGVAANFLCDNSSYILGADEKGKQARAVQCFEACAALHHKLLDGVDSPAARAVLAFFDTWQPELAAAHPLLAERWKDITDNANLVFCYDYTDRRTVTKDPAIQDAWQRHYHNTDPNAVMAQCLVTGQTAPIAATHPAIKGVPGAQSSGAALVSFNAPAFCSYGHEQGGNAPVSEYAAFAYTTALNTLLWSASPCCTSQLLDRDRDRDRCKIIGDTAVVCWAENADNAAADLGMNAIFGIPEDRGVQESDVTAALKALAAGKSCDWLDELILPDQHVYFLGLAPNAARLSVRFFLRDSIRRFAEHINQHREALEIVRPANDPWEDLPAWKLVRETVNQKERNPSPAPQLAGDLMRAILTGSRYPATLLNGVTLRIRAEREITRGRAAIIKAYYTRNRSKYCPEEVLTVTLNDESEYLPYVLGRLFAVLEAVQDAANPGINTTIKDRYFNSACATPAVIFPTLIKLAQKHLQKLDTGKSIHYNQQLTALMGMIHEGFPARMTLPEQGAFQLGYYHQTQKRYEKKNKGEN